MKKVTFREALNQAMDEEMARDEKVFLIGEDIGLYGGVFGVTKGLIQKYGPKRVRQTAISESAIIGAAIGSAMLGLRPVAEIMYFDFIAVCMDQVINQMAKIRYMSNGQLKVPMVIRSQAGGGRGKGPQHSQYLEAIFIHVPGIKVVAPSTPYDAKGLMKSAIRDDDPVIYIDNAFLYNMEGEIPEEEYTIPLGKGEIRREGSDITIVGYSNIMHKCQEACDGLQAQGISPELIDLRSIVPLDTDLILESVEKTGRLVVVHEACKKGGVGAEIASIVMERAFDCLDAPIGRVGAQSSPIPFAETLENIVLPSVETIKEKCLEVLGYEI